MPDSIERELLMANPIAAMLTQMRHALIDPNAPTAADGDRRHRAAADPAGHRGGDASRSGFWVFMREAPRIAENL